MHNKSSHCKVAENMLANSKYLFLILTISMEFQICFRKRNNGNEITLGIENDSFK